MSNGSKVTSQEAAAILNVTPSMVAHWRRKGMLRASRLNNVGYAYAVRDVYALRTILEHRATKTTRSTAAVADDAQLMAASALRRVHEMEHLLGLNCLELPTTEEEIRELQLWAKNATTLNVTVATVNECADRLFGVCDLVLTRMATLFRAKDPWRPLARAGVYFASTPYAHTDYPLAQAHRRLTAARRHLRAAVFAYCESAYGFRAALKLMPNDFGDVHDQILYLASEA